MNPIEDNDRQNTHHNKEFMTITSNGERVQNFKKERKTFLTLENFHRGR